MPPPTEDNILKLTRKDLYENQVPFVQQALETNEKIQKKLKTKSIVVDTPLNDFPEISTNQPILVEHERIRHSRIIENQDSDDSISKQFQPPLPRPKRIKKERKTIRKLTDENVGDLRVSSQIISPDSPTSPLNYMVTSPKVKPVSLDLESMKHKNSNTSSTSEITKAGV